MLSPRTIEVVKSTIPVLEENGEALTAYFYKRMFEGNPEVKSLFNPAHQHSQSQQRALAASICAYAKNIENPAALADAVELIAHKHASLGVQKEQYPIVGKHLLGSIRELLNLEADDEILAAWEEAYLFLAQVLTDREKQIYDSHDSTFGSAGFQQYRVTRKVTESSVITSFYLSPEGNANIGPFAPGQYLTVRITRDDGSTTMRNYSISSAPNKSHYRISVKKEGAATSEAPDGFVSNYLHEHVSPGDSIEVGPPCGVFTLDVSEAATKPLVLISGGVGVTPCMAMLHAAIIHQPTRPIIFIHGAINSDTHAFGTEVATLELQHSPLQIHVRYSNPLENDLNSGRCHSLGFVDKQLISSLLPEANGEYYFCGPTPFMANIQQALNELGVPADQQHYEFFGPAGTLTAAAT